MRRRILLVFMLLLAGCAANTQLVSDNYAGPTAAVRDSSAEAGQGTARRFQYFVLAAVDGREVQNHFNQPSSRPPGSIEDYKASFSGFKAQQRKVPVRAMKATLLATTYYPEDVKGPGGLYGADQIFFSSVSGIVSFTPVAGETYVVRGKADLNSASSWIETAGGQRVTDIVNMGRRGTQ